MNVIVNNKKREYQRRYREQNREKLKQREVERRKRIRYSLSIAGSSTSSNTNRIESNNEEIIALISHCSSGLKGVQSLCIQKNEQTKEKNPLQRKREYQQRYREQNREKLKQREVERRRRLKNTEIITDLSTSSNIKFTEMINEISTNSRNVTGLENMLHLFVEASQQNERDESNANGTKITNNYSKLRCYKFVHKYFNDKFKNNKFGHDFSIYDRLWFEKHLEKPFALGNIINKITDVQNVDALKICSISKSALDKNKIHNFLLLTETWFPADESVVDDLPNFNCVVKFKRQDIRDAIVAIYQNNNISNITTLNMDLTIQNATEVSVSQTSIGDLCSSHVILKDGRELVMVVVYISPNKKMNDIISYLHERLFSYSHRGAMIFKTNKHKLPLILAGDFNVNFSNDESMPLTTFLQEEFQLQINNNYPRKHTTSYHRPIVTVIPSKTTSNITITEVPD
ncbi:hypothetical protein PV327_005056 [Microctonus hyperodae]|uniref:Endonuclease/exonuclease/phosphatase domain-containing protein n=1 Tax=Microctonus hyperodae TaxID=165561 RepID=A0AA39KZE2_MICHY|nr:hypothetical protein PV327_005056 [Microctonus hyperodae]